MNELSSAFESGTRGSVLRALAYNWLWKCQAR